MVAPAMVPMPARMMMVVPTPLMMPVAMAVTMAVEVSAVVVVMPVLDRLDEVLGCGGLRRRDRRSGCCACKTEC
ncbi:hypothetical protein EV668_4213 [Enterovirga rhinocerotis]|uniref:Uncharacterized protein n=1 Tax=Enterovirga rhinocerotis TaxID=1339210 RepID=A0A4R7BPR2_9HYPH|nr:hypothetical protein EV668_4213 [Enterovirga rhinocerotis]